MKKYELLLQNAIFDIETLEKYPYLDYIKPFNIIENIYYVGNKVCSSYLIDTGEGLILIDTPFPSQTYLLINSIYEIGFNPNDIKYILHSHEHLDHIGGSKAFKELYGCKLVMSEVGANIVSKKSRKCCGDNCKYAYLDLFDTDIKLKDGDSITLGNTTIHAMSTPGHSEGVMSYFFNVENNGKIYTCGTFGGAGFNTLNYDYVNDYDVDYSILEAFKESLLKAKKVHVDIVLGNHPHQNNTFKKQEEKSILKENPFINPNEWQEYLQGVYDRFIVFHEKDKLEYNNK